MKYCQQSQETTALIGAITLDELFSARWNSYYPQPSAAGCFHFLVVIACGNLWGKEVKGAGGKKQVGTPATIPKSVTEWTQWSFFSFSDWSYQVFQSYMISFTIYPKRSLKKIKMRKILFQDFKGKLIVLMVELSLRQILLQAKEVHWLFSFQGWAFFVCCCYRIHWNTIIHYFLGLSFASSIGIGESKACPKAGCSHSECNRGSLKQGLGRSGEVQSGAE